VGVDPQSRSAILDRVLELRAAGRAVVYTTHYMDEAYRICDRIAIVDRGRVLAIGTLAELLALRKPAVVIPLPRSASRGDQIDNARLFADKGYGLVLDQEGLDPASLLASIGSALERGDDLVRAMRAAEAHDPTTRIADLLDELAA